MKKSLSITAIVTAGVLALAGCSGPSAAGATEQTTRADAPQAGGCRLDRLNHQ